MLILITLLIASTASHRVTESIEDLPPDAFNTTTLFPVGNKTGSAAGGTKVNGDATVWKLETSFGESNLDKKDLDKNDVSTTTSVQENTTFTPRVQNKSKTHEEFRPSPHLGNFFDDDSLVVVPTKATISDFRPLKKPASGFISFSKDKFKPGIYHTPKEVFKPNSFPYKMEPHVFRGKHSWRPADSLESKPTMESPMRVPAGDLYQSPEAFKDKPGSDEDFGLNLDELKDHNNVDMKKRVNPWKHLLQLVTAFIPVGLIISALTPNVITVQSTGPDSGYPSNLYRRSDPAELAPISEPCRRRLLCELHSDNTYEQNPKTGRVRRRHCYRLYCEDPEALARMLQWLLTHKAGEKRGHHLT